MAEVPGELTEAIASVKDGLGLALPEPNIFTSAKLQAYGFGLWGMIVRSSDSLCS